MDAELLSKMGRHVEISLPHVRSVLVVRRGYIVFERYYQGTDRNTHHQVASVTKSFTSALLGVALKQGHIKSLDQKVTDYFPEYVRPDTAPAVKAITVRQLLTMTSGLEWSEGDTGRLTGADNWVQFTLSLPASNAPAGRFNYNSAASHLLSGVLTRATGMSAARFADKHLFGPLGIASVQWPADPQGHSIGGFSMSLKSRDMAKLGYLYLNDGRWEGKQIIPSEYVKESTRKQSEGGFPEGESYGYQWWVTSVKGHPAYFAGGFGGQFLYVIPDLDIVVAITSNLDRPHMENRNIVAEFVVPAAAPAPRRD
jgi:CubicO group peptidase (beta-lactamase class C family)